MNSTALFLEGGHLASSSTACWHRRQIFEQSGNSQTGPIPPYWIFLAARRECWCNIRPSGNGIAGIPQVSPKYLTVENPAARTKPASGGGQRTITSGRSTPPASPAQQPLLILAGYRIFVPLSADELAVWATAG